MSTFALADLAAALRSIGRGVVFQSAHWTEAADIALTHLGDTEGEITFTANETFVGLTTPELTGAAMHNAYVEGANPTVSIPLFVADPAVRAVLSPTGSASGGYERRRPVTMRTLAIFPEELFYNGTGYGDLTYTTADGWEVDGTALTATQTALLGQSIWLWKGYFSTPPFVLRHADGGKAVEQVTFQCVYDAEKPDGHRLWTIGNPITAGILLDVV